MSTFTLSVELYQVTCGECGGVYAITERYRQEKHQKGGSWNCPYCQCGWGYSGNGENAKLKQALEAKERELREAKCKILDEQNQRHAIEQQKAKVDRKLKRVTRGVCPECNRTFQNLATHMQTQHNHKTACHPSTK